MDQLFNCFNSGTRTSNAKMRHAMSLKSGHKEFLVNCLTWLDGIKSLGPRKLPCLSGWQMAIKGLLQLWDELHSKYKLSYLLTNRLNQDCLENLFSIIRGKGGHRDNPDACQFRSAFRQVMVDAIMVPSAGANCQEDIDTFLVTLNNIGTSGFAKSAVNVTHSSLPIPVSVQSVMTLPGGDLPLEECNVLAYITGL